MKHLGDVKNIHGWDIEPVDVLTGGSPCQDLSVAGLRKGMKHEELDDEETTRSGLFMEQIRIAKEMRERDRAMGRTGLSVRCRYFVWENVCGAYSSNSGRDFQTVVTEIIRVADPTAPTVPVPDGGWPKYGCYYSEMGSWSLAYRTVDAQFFGTPQRRKRIALVCDFNGLTAPEILFDPQLRGETEDGEPDETFAGAGNEPGRKVSAVGESLPRNPESCRETGEGTSEGTERSAGETVRALSFQERAGKPGGGKGILIQDEHVGALSTLTNQSVFAYGIDQQGGKGGANYQTDKSPTILSDSHGTPHAVAYGISAYDSNAMKSKNPHSGIYKADTSRTLDLNGGSPACNQGGMMILNKEQVKTFAIEGNGTRKSHFGNGYAESDVMYTLNTIEQHAVAAVDCRNGTENPEINGTLQAKNQGVSLNLNNVVRVSAFTQNQREEVRDLEDVAGSLSSEPGTHQQTYVAQTEQKESDNG